MCGVTLCVGNGCKFQKLKSLMQVKFLLTPLTVSATGFLFLCT